MDIDQQIQELVANAPSDGKTPSLVRAIAPALKAIAGDLNHLEYFVNRTSDRAWVVTTLQHRENPSAEKKVVCAYPTLADAKNSDYRSEHANVSAIPIPVIHILFQMLAMKTVNSTVFFEHSGQSTPAVEVSKQQLMDAVKEAYQKRKPPSSQGSELA
ncbi:MAG: hypothetical protein VKL39_14055 [Leptolyngbyaceae bacterium]|nr:hypothetical protein [Leptolyngbyaceae bacterium]